MIESKKRSSNLFAGRGMIAPAVALAALAGTANAQFVAGGAGQPAPPAAPVVEQSSTQTIVMTTDDGKTYKVTLKNSEIENAWVDGQKVGNGLVVREGGNIHFLSDDGKVEQTFSIAIEPPKAPDVASFFERRSKDKPFIAVNAEFNPPVMLGINLSEPGEALRAQLGIGEIPAILVDGVIDGLPAQKAGLQRYDIIVSLDGSEGCSSESLSKLLAKKSAGDALQMHVMRGGKKIELVAKLAAYDAKALGQEAQIIYDDDPRFPGLAGRSGQNRDVQIWVDREGKGLERFPGASDQQLEEARRAMGIAKQAEQEMQSKIGEAMREAERRVLELREGKLFFRDADRVAAQAADQISALQNELRARMPGMEAELEARLNQIEQRFDAIESRFDEQIERLGTRMERLADIMERLADRLERSADPD
jgi:uncharacterized protein YukE